MKWMLKTEEGLLFLLFWTLSQQLNYPGWIFWAWLLAPDLGLIGYLMGPRAGAATYNLTHHKGIAVGLYLVGMIAEQPLLQMTGLVMLAHSSMDRVFGYGLKYPDSFHNTHLGLIGAGSRPASGR